MDDLPLPSSPMDDDNNNIDLNEIFDLIFDDPPVVVDTEQNHHQTEENVINIDQSPDLDRLYSLSLATEPDNQNLQSNSTAQFMDLTDVGRFLPQNLQSNNPSAASEGRINIDWSNVGGFPNPSEGGYLMDPPNNGELFPSLPAFEGNNLSVWPIPFNCTCCHVLREIIHVHGTNVTKLEIHGLVGMISHAILDNRYAIDCNGNTRSEYQMFDFSKKSIEDVREFLLQYCDERRRSGHELIQDPLLVYYETLSVGLFPDYLDVADFFPPAPLPPFGFGEPSSLSGPNVNANGASTSGTKGDGDDGGATNAAEKGKDPMVEEGRFLSFQHQQQEPLPHEEQQQKHNEESGGGGGKGKRTTLALQRERTGRLALGDLKGYFNLPMEVAAKKMNVCPTVMKKICRREGLPRWPYRKINSLERKVKAKTIILNLKDGYERERVQAEIDLLQKEIDDIIAGLLEKK